MNAILDKARSLWQAIGEKDKPHSITPADVNDAAQKTLDAVQYAMPSVGANGNWWVAGADTGKPSQGNAGESVPVNCYISKVGLNGDFCPPHFKWISNLKVSKVLLMTGTADISVTVADKTYNKSTLIGVELPVGTEMQINDIVIVAGKNTGEALIIFENI